jgi:hypothetical protein
MNHGGQSPAQNACGPWVRNINGGVFASPNYPNTYPPNKECVYILEGGLRLFMDRHPHSCAHTRSNTRAEQTHTPTNH